MEPGNKAGPAMPAKGWAGASPAGGDATPPGRAAQVPPPGRGFAALSPPQPGAGMKLVRRVAAIRPEPLAHCFPPGRAPADCARDVRVFARALARSPDGLRPAELRAFQDQLVGHTPLGQTGRFPPGDARAAWTQAQWEPVLRAVQAGVLEGARGDLPSGVAERSVALARAQLLADYLGRPAASPLGDALLVWWLADADPAESDSPGLEARFARLLESGRLLAPEQFATLMALLVDLHHGMQVAAGANTPALPDPRDEALGALGQALCDAAHWPPHQLRAAALCWAGTVAAKASPGGLERLLDAARERAHAGDAAGDGVRRARLHEALALARDPAGRLHDLMETAGHGVVRDALADLDLLLRLPGVPPPAQLGRCALGLASLPRPAAERFPLLVLLLQRHAAHLPMGLFSQARLLVASMATPAQDALAPQERQALLEAQERLADLYRTTLLDSLGLGGLREWEPRTAGMDERGAELRALRVCVKQEAEALAGSPLTGAAVPRRALREISDALSWVELHSQQGGEVAGPPPA